MNLVERVLNVDGGGMGADASARGRFEVGLETDPFGAENAELRHRRANVCHPVGRSLTSELAVL